MRRLNVKLFLYLVAGCVLFVGTLFLVHWLQAASIGRALLARADKAEQRDDLRQTTRYLSRYLELMPEDVDQRAHLGKLLADERMAVSPKTRNQAVFVIEQVLLKDPQRSELRLALARLALELDRVELAQQNLAYLQKQLPDNGAVEQLQAQAAAAQKNWAEAAAWYRKAGQHAPQQVDTYVLLADLLRRQMGPDKDGSAAREADQVMNELVAQNAQDYQAYLARWRYRKQWGKSGEPNEDDVKEAVRRAPENADVLLAAAELAQGGEKAEEALTYLTKGKRLYPHDPRMYRELAMLEMRRKQRGNALTCLRDGVKSLGGAAQAEVLWTLANLLIDGNDPNDVTEARAVVAQMVKARATSVAVDYLNARLHIHGANWAEAARLLDRTRLQLSNTPELSSQVDLLLSQCHEQLDDPVARISDLGRMITRDPSSVSAQLGMAEALTAAGQLDDALKQYRQLMALRGAPPSGWIEIARLMVVRELQRKNQGTRAGSGSPARASNWKSVEEALQTAEKANAGAVELVILRAEVLIAQGKTDDARKLLTDAADQQKDKVQLWAGLASVAMLDDQGKDLKQALQYLDDAKRNVGDTLELRLARTEFWARQGGAEAAPALAQLARDLDKFSPLDQSRLLGSVAAAFYHIGATKDAARLWETLARQPQNQTDLRLRLLLFDLAHQTDDDSAMQRVTAELKQIEGEQGTLWRYAAAVRLIRQAQLGTRAGLADARPLLDAVTARRPEWPTVLVAKAELEETSNNLDQAITEYRKAMMAGERSPRVVRQLVQLLYKQQRYEEADQEVRRLQQNLTEGADIQQLQRLAAGISLLNDDRDRAIKIAREAVSADSKDYRDHLWQGQVLAASGQDAEAEKELRKAVQLNDSIPECWVTLVQFLARKERVAEAERAIEQAGNKLPADKAAQALALCYEVVNRIDRADEQYQKALAQKPGNVPLLQATATFHMRTGQWAKAEPVLRAMMERRVDVTPQEAAWARHTLALTLANRGDYAKAFPLAGLLPQDDGRITEAPLNKDDDPVEERRIRAQVLATQPWRESRKLAMTILDELSNRRLLVADDEFLLAQLAEADGSWPKARDLLRLLTSKARTSSYLSYYAQAALRHRELDDAERCIGHLEQLEKARRLAPNALSAVEMRVSLLELKGDKDKALALIKSFAERDGARPTDKLLLAGAMLRQGKDSAALELCLQARTACPPELVAKATLAVLRQAKANEETCAAVEVWLQEECRKNPKSASLWLTLADVQDLRGRYDDAETCCRESLKYDDHNLVAMNNLAWLLAQRPGKAAEALKLIDSAIAYAGPRAELLDTRASAYIALNRADLAVKDLEAALVDAPVPTRYFHLAQAHQLAKNTNKAAEALQKATGAGLTKADQLHPVERAAFLKLKGDLEQR